MVRLKNYLAFEVVDDLFKLYRGGLKLSASKKKTDNIGFFVAFSGLNEAIVSEIEREYVLELIKDNHFLKNEYEW